VDIRWFAAEGAAMLVAGPLGRSEWLSTGKLRDRPLADVSDSSDERLRGLLFVHAMAALPSLYSVNRKTSSPFPMDKDARIDGFRSTLYRGTYRIQKERGNFNVVLNIVGKAPISLGEPTQ